MRSSLFQLKTVFALGLTNVFMVILYRLKLKLSFHSVCRIKVELPVGPFFTKCTLPISRLPSASAWDNSISLFGNIRVPLNGKKPDWLKNIKTGAEFTLPLKPWWKISDFGENTGDIKIIWEISRMGSTEKSRGGAPSSLNQY